MNNKMITGAIIAIVLLSLGVLFWYFNPSNVSIASIDAPAELETGQLGSIKVNMQNNASNDVNVTINVKNSFVDGKGERLKGVWVVAYENLSYISSNESEVASKPQKEVILEPGTNSMTFNVGYEVPGPQKAEVELYQYGKLIDYRAIEINVPSPKIAIQLWDHKGINGTNEVYAVYGDLKLTGKGRASGVVVDITVINEETNTTISTVSRTYSINTNQYEQHEPLVVWESRNSTSDPVTGMRTTFFTQTFAPIVVIELSNGEPSAEKYIMSRVAVKGKSGERYKVVVTARWWDQAVSSEIGIPT